MNNTQDNFGIKSFYIYLLLTVRVMFMLLVIIMAIAIFNSGANIGELLFISVMFISLTIELGYYLNSNVEAIVSGSRIILIDIFSQKIEIPITDINEIRYNRFYFTFNIISNSKSYRLTLSIEEAQKLKSILIAKSDELDI